MLDTDTEETLVKKLTIKVMKLSITAHSIIHLPLHKIIQIVYERKSLLFSCPERIG